MNQSKPKYDSIDEYIMSFPDRIQDILHKIRRLIRDMCPEAEETISYQIPTFTLKKKNLVHFAAFKNHIGFYPTPTGIEAFKDELKNYETSKGTVKFPLNKEIPYDLIKKIVEFRVKETMEK